MRFGSICYQRRNLIDILLLFATTRMMTLNLRFDLYVLDSELPGFSGLTLCQRIRAADARTPIVIFSAHGFESHREAGMLAGADAYVVKPDVTELIPTVKRLLEEPRTADL